MSTILALNDETPETPKWDFPENAELVALLVKSGAATDLKVKIGHDEMTPLEFVNKWDSEIDNWNDQGKWPPMIRALQGE